MRPRIGIPCGTLRDEPRFFLNHAYARAVDYAGGAPVLVPSLPPPPRAPKDLAIQPWRRPRDGPAEWQRLPAALGASEALRSLYEMLDGVLLPGGADIQPSAYGAQPHPKLGRVDPALDETELQLARWALAEGKPVLGICRGQQCLNVACGGTLYQDIASEVPNALDHRHEERAALVHDIEVDPDSLLAHLLGARRISVNSLHHQAVRDMAPGWIAVARAPDGIVEGMECLYHPFAVSVQFHPEELVPGHEASERLLQRFIEVAAGGKL